MPLSARTRSAIRTTVVTLAATIALLGIADTATAGSFGQARSAAVTSHATGPDLATVLLACGACGTGF
jgi:hypothetical protein